MGILNQVDYYILREVRKPFVFSFFIFASLWIINLLIRILNLAISKGVDWETLFKLILYFLPQVIVTSLPMSILMGCMLGLTRMNNDSEITALKAAGISSYRMVLPLLAMGLFFSGISFFLSEYVVPKGKFLSQQVYINEITLKKPLPKFAKNLFFDGGNKFKVYVRDFDTASNLMKNITMFQFREGYPTLTQAESASIENGNLWVFRKGKTSYFDQKGHTVHQIEFERWVYPISDRYAKKITRNPTNLSPKEMSLEQLSHEIEKRRKKKISPKEFETQYHFRIAFPMASFFMVLLGAPLALKPTRGGRSSGFGVAILILILYYVLLSTGKSLSGNGTLPPALANWMANAASLVFGLVFLKRSQY